jgi:Fic family protein
MKSLNTRHLRILEYLQKNSNKSSTEIIKFLIGVSRATVNRDLVFLIQEKKIYKTGEGNNTRYFIAKSYSYTRPYSLDYFYKGPGDRNAKTEYNPLITRDLVQIDIFTDQEVEELRYLTQTYTQNMRKLDKKTLEREYERIIIEMSWMSSRIEGNTYSLIDTEFLLTQNKVPDRHTRKETQMILNHKEAILYIRKYKSAFKNISVKAILKVHKILIKNLEIKGIRKTPVGITGTLYKPLVGRTNLKNELANIVVLLQKKRSVYDKALLANLLLAYLQPFIDGNKRTSRIISNAILMSNNYPPLSLLTLDEGEYRRAMLLFYEQNNLSLFKKIFMEQYRFAVEDYFLA